MAALSRSMCLQFAEELQVARDEIERLGGALCADPAVVTRHMTALQALDLVGQRQLALAMVLRAPDPATAIAAITLEDLRVRLQSAVR